jgi:hypothetical protein
MYFVPFNKDTEVCATFDWKVLCCFFYDRIEILSSDISKSKILRSILFGLRSKHGNYQCLVQRKTATGASTIQSNHFCNSNSFLVTKDFTDVDIHALIHSSIFWWKSIQSVCFLCFWWISAVFNDTYLTFLS